MPRKITNKHGFPPPFVRALSSDDYEARGDISVTTLLDSPIIRLLKRKYDYEEDVSDMVAAMLGTATHYMLEKAAGRYEMDPIYGTTQEIFVKSEFQMEVQYGSKIVTGTTDIVMEKKGNPSVSIVYDYKITKSYSYSKGAITNPKWINQIKIYCHWLKHYYGVNVTEAYLIIILKDWTKSKAQYDKQYPQHPMMLVKVDISDSKDEMDRFINERLNLHFDHEDLFNRGFDVPYCSAEERWAKPEVWKMMVPGRKRSMRNFEITDDTSKNDAVYYYNQKKMSHPTLLIDKIPGSNTRCEEYCPVNKFCKFYQDNYTSGKQNVEFEPGFIPQNVSVPDQIASEINSVSEKDDYTKNIKPIQLNLNMKK